VAKLAASAPAKLNLTLRILGRRGDGYHDLVSLVAFAPFGDRLTFQPGVPLALEVDGPAANGAGPIADNFVLRAARALAARIEGLRLGGFQLTKQLPSGAGLGGGSADAAAALWLLAKANDIGLNDPRLAAAARETGADVAVCLDPRPRLMGGVGDVLSGPLTLPRLGIVVVHPGVAVPTKSVFAALGLKPGERAAVTKCDGSDAALPDTVAFASAGTPNGSTADTIRQVSDIAPADATADVMAVAARVPTDREVLLAWLAWERNDLQAAAIALAPVISDVLREISTLPRCRLARMSGSGSACFGLFDSAQAATAAARRLKGMQPAWWVRAGGIGASEPDS
jgi:4-diphosphocytidyl-2-C-methyl-D-erythritol kinase